MANITNITDCCSNCDEVNLLTRHIPARFSFVYVQMVWGFILIVLIAQFLFVMFHKRKDILKYHDTISSFCAYKQGWESRFLLIFTLVVSANMLSILFEEYNGRYWEIEAAAEWELSLVFLSDVICIGVFPFVGIFYTKGNHPDPKKHNKDYECPYGNCRIETSQTLHQIGAYVFITGLCCTSVVWGIFFVVQFVHTKYYALGIFSLIWGILQSFAAIAFGIMQIVLGKSFRIKDAWLSGKEFRQKSHELDSQLRCRIDTGATELDITEEETEDDDTDANDVKHDVIGKDQQQYRLIATKLRYASFIVEALVGASVIALFNMNTIIRMSFENVVHENDMITRFANEQGSDLSLDGTNAWVMSVGIIIILIVAVIMQCILYTKRHWKQMEIENEVDNEVVDHVIASLQLHSEAN